MYVEPLALCVYNCHVNSSVILLFIRLSYSIHKVFSSVAGHAGYCHYQLCQDITATCQIYVTVTHVLLPKAV